MGKRGSWPRRGSTTGRSDVAATEGDRDARCDALLRDVARGDRKAFATLFSEEAGRLLAISRRIVRRTELAEEVVQESFVAIWRRAPGFDRDRGAARAWMTAIVRNRSLNLVRDGGREELLAADDAAFESAAGDAEQAYEALGETDDLRRCLGALEPARRSAILLAYVAGFTHGEIAARLRAPVGTVKAWIRRGVAALRECMS